MTEGGESEGQRTRGRRTDENASVARKKSSGPRGESGERDQLREEDTGDGGRETHERERGSRSNESGTVQRERARPANLLAVSVPVPLE